MENETETTEVVAPLSTTDTMQQVVIKAVVTAVIGVAVTTIASLLIRKLETRRNNKLVLVENTIPSTEKK